MPINVLLVDDSKAMRSAIKKMIHISGIDVGEFFEASNGKEALALLVDEWIDVILTDIHMPEMDGLALLDSVGRDEVLKRIPVIVITTEGREERIQEAFGKGAKGYIKKPFTPEQFKQTVTEVIGEEYAVDAQADLEGSDF